MVVRKLNKEEFCLLLQRIIFRLGIDRALNTDKNGNVVEGRQFYSGPCREIDEELKEQFRLAGLVYLNNWHISEIQAAREGVIRIDDTYVGRILGKLDLVDYFFAVYKNRKQAEDATYYVWSYASRAFAAAGRGPATTAVNGAAEDRVYRREETDEMDKRRNYETLNDRPANGELDTIKGDEGRFHRRTSLIELRRSLHIALHERKPELAREYFRRKEFYLLKRRNEFADVGKEIPRAYQANFEERRRREAIFVLAILGLDPATPTYGKRVLPAKTAAMRRPRPVSHGLT
jgi:hypothetical protein